MSPTAVDRLEPGSEKGQVKAAISDCIATEVRAGKSQEQAVAMCMEMSRKKTSKAPLAPMGGK